MSQMMLSKPILAKSHRYVALLRGINVGGKNKVAMADLKACLEQAGLDNVSTYINSGKLSNTRPLGGGRAKPSTMRFL